MVHALQGSTTEGLARWKALLPNCCPPLLPLLSFVLFCCSFLVVMKGLMDFLWSRKGLACKISGKASLGEASSTMGDYRAKLADRLDAPHKDSPGTFFLDTASGQAEVRAGVSSSHGGLLTVYHLVEENMVDAVLLSMERF